MTLRVRVARREPETADVCRLELAALDGELPAFEAGAHIDVHLPGGLVRQYSLCNPGGGRYEIAVLREPASRGGSAAVHERLREGDEIAIGVPRQLFGLHHGAPHHLLLAGGIGITPLLAMAERLHRDGGAFTLHHAARSAARAPFLRRLRAAAYAARVHHHFSDDGSRLDLSATLRAAPAGTHLYVCGPQRLITAALDTARALGWAEERLHHEAFNAPAEVADGVAFELEIAGTGQVIEVAAGQTALQALCAAGIEVPASCEQGICGTCETRVLEGRPDHRDQYFTPQEHAANDRFLPCCSRAHSPRLVIAP